MLFITTVIPCSPTPNNPAENVDFLVVQTPADAPTYQTGSGSNTPLTNHSSAASTPSVHLAPGQIAYAQSGRGASVVSETSMAAKSFFCCLVSFLTVLCYNRFMVKWGIVVDSNVIIHYIFPQGSIRSDIFMSGKQVKILTFVCYKVKCSMIFH